MIENRQVRLPRAEATQADRIEDFVEERLGTTALRWCIAQITDDELVIEATFDDEMAAQPSLAESERIRAGQLDAVVSIVPTGVGCEFGGFAGDSAPITRLLGAACDVLVTNPNAVNASNFISLDDNVLYTEGSCIDLLMQGRALLHRPRGNRIGLIVEKTSEADLDIVFNVINTARSVYGMDLVDVVVTDRPIGSHCVENASGCFVGTVDHPEVIANAAQALLAKGAEAIGITTNIQDLPHDAYVKHFEGEYPNPLGGVEAIISHLVVNRFRVPAAHAPMINLKALDLADPVVDARGSGEIASVSGLACVLIGLAKAPQISLERQPRVRGSVGLGDIVAVVAPSTALGGIPTLYARRFGIPVIAVEANDTILEVDAQALGLDGVLTARTYAEAAGLILALRKGIAIDTINRPLPTIRHRRHQDEHRSRRVLELAAKIA